MSQTASAPPIRRILPPGKGRDTSALSQPTRTLTDVPRAPWWDMPDGPERTKASMIWNCDELHKQGRNDLAKSMSAAFKLNWEPKGTNTRQTPKAPSLSFDDGGETVAAPDLQSAHSDAQAHYDPFAAVRDAPAHLGNR